MLRIFKKLPLMFALPPSMAALLGAAAVLAAVACSPVSQATPNSVEDARQMLRLGRDANAYPFLVYANTDVYHPSSHIERAVVILHGVQRDADQYFKTGRKLLANADLSPDKTLLLAPNFLTESDPGASEDMPMWTRDKWMHGIESQAGHVGISGFQVLDDLITFLSDRQRFPALKEIVMVSHSAGAQLMQRYAVVNDHDAALRAAGLSIRYVVASPSTYLYFEDNRLQNGAFAPVKTIMCPSYSRYRYGLDDAPTYLIRQHLSPQQLFARYAARDVTYLVGARDDNPNSRIMDSSCGAGYQGATRVERQLNYVAYEKFLSAKWQVPIDHPAYSIPGVGHSAARLFETDKASQVIFP